MLEEGEVRGDPSGIQADDVRGGPLCHKCPRCESPVIWCCVEWPNSAVLFGYYCSGLSFRKSPSEAVPVVHMCPCRA